MISPKDGCLLDDPRSYKKARDRPDHNKRPKGMKDDIATIVEKAVWTLSVVLDGKKVISTS